MKTIGNTPIEFLTKREYFAAMAMQGLIANGIDLDYPESEQHYSIVEDSVWFADKLIKELNTKTESDEGNEV